MMPISVSLKAKGLDDVIQILESLQDIGSKVKGATLDSVPRKGAYAIPNPMILNILASKHKKPYARPKKKTKEAIAKAFVDEVEKQLGGAFSKASAVFAGVFKGDEFATKLASDALKKAIEVYMDNVAERIVEGGSIKTGQLLDNVEREDLIKIKKQ